MTTENSKSSTVLVLETLPPENAIVAHIAARWIEVSEDALKKRQLLGTAKGGMPPAAAKIIDTPLASLPHGTVLNFKDEQTRLAIIAQNQRNKLQRDEIILNAT